MILDTLRNASLYHALGPRFAAALRWLADTDLEAVAVGRHDIDGQDVFALVQENRTRPQAEGVWEAHRKYADVQCVVRGPERMGCTDLGDLTVTRPYDEKDDALLATGSGNFFHVAPGRFAIFLPHDAHMPGVAIDDAPADVRKVVVKVRMA